MGNRYWVGGSGNWSDTAHWSDTSGGAGGHSLPTSSDYVYFNDKSYPSGISSTINVDIDPSSYDLQFFRDENNPQNIIDFTGRTINVSRSLYFSDDHFILTGATISIGEGSTVYYSILSFSCDNNPIYDTENLTIHVIKRNSYYDSKIYFFQDMTIPVIFVDHTNESGYNNSFDLIIEEENCNIHIGEIYNNIIDDFETYMHIMTKEGSSFSFDNFNLSGSLEHNFQIYMANYFWNSYDGYSYPTTLLQTSGTVSIERVNLNGISADGGATWINKYSNDLEHDEEMTGWIYYSPLYWIGGSGDLMDPQNWSLTSGGSPSNYPPFKYYDYDLYRDNIEFCFDLIFDENSFTEDNSIISFNIGDIPTYLSDIYTCRSLDSRNSTKTFTLKLTSDNRPFQCNLNMLDCYLSDKIIITGDILDLEDDNSISCFKFNVKNKFLQDGATIGPQFLLDIFEYHGLPSSLQILSDLKFEEFTGILIYSHNHNSSFNSNGYSITAPIVIFKYEFEGGG